MFRGGSKKVHQPSVIFSLIIPFYCGSGGKCVGPCNDCRMLGELIETVPDRSCLEILICPDRCLVPASLLHLEHASLRIIHSDVDKFAGAARNRGIDHAKGEWIFFADADDKFTVSIGEILDKVLSLPDASVDSVYFHTASFGEGEIPSSRNRSSYSERMLSMSKATASRGPLTNIFVPYGRICRRELVEKWGLQFGLGRVANDVSFGVGAALRSKSITILPETGYLIRRRSGSLVSLKDSTACRQRILEKRRANREIDNAGYRSYRVPILLDLIHLYKVCPSMGIAEMGKAIWSREMILPPLWRIASSLGARIRRTK